MKKNLNDIDFIREVGTVAERSRIIGEVGQLVKFSETDAEGMVRRVDCEWNEALLAVLELLTKKENAETS